MNKEIEEMVKIIDKDEFYGLAEKTPKLIAEELYNAGYRKVYDDRFILKHDKSGYNFTEEEARFEEMCKKCTLQVRKETAKEILNLITKEETIKDGNIYVISEVFRDFLKTKYGVEIDDAE